MPETTADVFPKVEPIATRHVGRTFYHLTFYDDTVWFHQNADHVFDAFLTDHLFAPRTMYAHASQ